MRECSSIPRILLAVKTHEAEHPLSYDAGHRFRDLSLVWSVMVAERGEALQVVHVRVVSAERR